MLQRPAAPQTLYELHIEPEGKPLLPAEGFVRQPTILSLIPIGRSTLWEMIKRGDFPAPFKISAGVSAWRCDDVRAFIASRQSRRHWLNEKN